MTKSIYLEKKSEAIIKEYAEQKGVSVSKAINILIQAIESPQQAPQKVKESKPIETKKEPIKAPVKVSMIEQRKNDYLAQRIKELSK